MDFERFFGPSSKKTSTVGVRRGDRSVDEEPTYHRERGKEDRARDGTERGGRDQGGGGRSGTR